MNTDSPKPSHAPLYIKEAHWQEWTQKSGIDPELTAIAIRSLEDYQAYSRLIYSPLIPRRNDGRLTNHWLKKYDHTLQGGWWCDAGDKDELWGCFKPDKPRRDWQNPGKKIKYEHPPRTETGIFLLPVTIRLWKKIAARHKIPLPPTLHLEVLTKEELRTKFWDWVKIHPEVDIVLTEGVKKAAKAITEGRCAIGLPGIFNGYRQAKNEHGEKIGQPYLIPQLAEFAIPGRTFLFGFDSESKTKTRENVNRSIKKTGRLLLARDCQVKVMTWHHKRGKGLDDLIVTYGSEIFDTVYKNAIPLALWETRLLSQLTYTPQVEVQKRYLGDITGNIPSPESAKIIAIKSPKDTGKTHSLESIVQNSIARNTPVLNLVHRNQLGVQSSNRFGLAYLGSDEWKDPYIRRMGIGLCIDSLHPQSQARFNADEWEGCTVVIDECEQLIWHILNSSTCEKERIAILEQLTTLAQKAGQFFLSDADLSDTSINYIKNLSGYEGNPYLIVNNYDPEIKKTAYHYPDSNPGRLIHDSIKIVEEGGRAFIYTDGQKIKSQWSTQNLETLFANKLPDKSILRIDSESVADPLHPAYGCIDKLNEILPLYDIVIVSPAIETGVSIDIKGHFTVVAGISHGVTPENSFRQALARVREPVPRLIWAKSYGIGAIGKGETSVKRLLYSEHRQTKANIKKLNQSGLLDIDDGMENYSSLNTYAQMAVRINGTMPIYRQATLEGLKDEGYDVIDVLDDSGGETARAILTEVKKNRDLNYAEELKQIVVAPDLTQENYKLLKDQKAKTKTERHQERKYQAYQKYGVQITTDLLAADDRGMYPKMRLFYYQTLGRDYLAQRDKTRAISQLESGGLWQPGFNRSQLALKIQTLDFLGITELLSQPERELRKSDEDLQEIESKALRYKDDIRSVLGVKVSEKLSTIANIKKLLGVIGWSAPPTSKSGGRGSQERVYRLTPPSGWDEIFSVWLERDRINFESVVTFCNKEYIQTNRDYRNGDYQNGDYQNGDYVTDLVNALKAGAEAVRALFGSWGAQLRSLAMAWLTENVPDALGLVGETAI